MNISIDLASNIDSYVAAYIIVKKNSLLCLFTYNKYKFISPISFQRMKIKLIQHLQLNLYKLKQKFFTPFIMGILLAFMVVLLYNSNWLFYGNKITPRYVYDKYY